MAHEVELKALAGYLERNNLKHTKQRELILIAFLEARRHVTSEDLYQRVREQNPTIGYTTVYRTMKLLAEAGLATERHFDDGITRYEIEQEHHDHLVCTRCGRIIEFECDLIEDAQNRIAKQHEFLVLRHRHELYGHCSDCRKD
ncbi:MAG: transcriptional repressor [Deltaproteobacteria bacterium]|jgi:Fur family ferric uptake transcriptional regulator|nr:transcriptional repressor [Deltaproteobacteria bacterium]